MIIYRYIERKFFNEQLTKHQVKNLQVVVCKTRLSNTIFKSNEQTKTFREPSTWISFRNDHFKRFLMPAIRDFQLREFWNTIIKLQHASKVAPINNS